MKINLFLPKEDGRAITDNEYEALLPVITRLTEMKAEISTSPNYECYIISVTEIEYTIIHQGPNLGQLQELTEYTNSKPMIILKSL